MKKRLLIFGLLFILLATALIWFAYYLSHTSEVRLNVKHISTIKVYKDDTLVSSVAASAGTIRLDKDQSYRFDYTATDGYSSGSKTLAANQSEIVIDPYLSNDKLTALLITESPMVMNTLVSKYPTMPQLYKVTNQHLFHFGEWYGATLQYIGSDIFNSDNLRVVAHKVNGSWTIVTEPPMPSLNTYAYPNVPVDILTAVNDAF